MSSARAHAGGSADAGEVRRGASIRRVRVGAVHGSLDRGNHRLARVSPAGTVWCLHVETAEPYECDFTPDSGTWLDADDGGRYALAGQAVGRDGTPGGEWVVASRIDDDGAVPAPDPRALADAAGTPTGCELAGGGIIEVFLSPANAAGRPLQHVCRLPVQTSTHPHPDGALLVGSPVGPVFTYVGRGAALNDVNGGEIGENGHYLSLPAHVAWSGGFEVVAAKRPAVRNFPAPTRVVPESPLVWRPYAAGVVIGSTGATGGCPP